MFSHVSSSVALVRLSALALAAALSVGLAHGQEPASPSVVATVPPQAVGTDGLDLEQAERLQGLSRVALAGVALYVITEADAGASAGAAYRGSTMAVVNSSIKVRGLEPARLQALADQAHQQLRDALQARGIEVMPAAQLQALPEYAAFQAVADKAPLALDTKGGKGQVFAGGGLPLLHMDELAWLHRTVGGLFGAKVDDPYVAMGDKMSVGFRKVKIDPALDALGKAAGVPLVFARVVLTAAQVKSQGGAWARTAAQQIPNSLLMPAWTNRLLVRRSNGDIGRVSLKNPLVSEAPLGELVDATSTATKAADVATTVLTMAAAFYGHGRGVSQSTSDLELHSTPDQFDAVALPQVGAVLKGLAEGLKP